MPTYHRPTCLQDALPLLAEGPVTVAAGCTDLFPATDRPLLSGPVLDITAIDALRGISVYADHIHIGATTTWTDIIGADLPPSFDMLKEAAREVGSIQIQNAGTVAGNLCNASSAADGVPCLLALDAKVSLASTRGERQLPLAEFLTGPRQTQLAPDELVTGLVIPNAAARGRSRFVKLGARKYLVISIAMIAARLEVEAGLVKKAAIAVGACSAVATRLPALERALTGQAADGSLANHVTPDLVAPHLSAIDDIRADAPYRHHAAVQLIQTALTDLADTAQGRAA